MSGRLKAGLVISLRINPKDCMSVVDVLAKTGMIVPGMSFSAMTALALSSLLETMRQQGHIPTRSGFEFTEMMTPYLDGRHARKVAAAKALEGLGSDFSAPVMPAQETVLPRHEAGQLTPPPHQLKNPHLSSYGNEQSSEHRQAARRLTELLQKKDLAEDGAAGVVWSATDQAEYNECYAVVYPEG